MLKPYRRYGKSKSPNSHSAYCPICHPHIARFRGSELGDSLYPYRRFTNSISPICNNHIADMLYSYRRFTSNLF